MSNLYSRGVINIPSVTGNVVITATATQGVVLSISAVYTQSGTVYDEDSLDSLKTDLVVVAQYEGGVSGEVSSYTLSGSLEAGTSVITVTYAGKTATFNVTVSELLVPTHYTAYDYIQHRSTQNESPGWHIYLPTQPNLNALSMEMKFEPLTVINSANAIIGVRKESDWLTSYSFYLMNNYKTQGVVNKRYWVTDGTSIELNKVSTITINNPSDDAHPSVTIDNYVVDDSEWHDDSGTAYTLNAGLCLFGNPTAGANTSTMLINGRIGRIKLRDRSGNVVSDCVPCTNPSGKYGMWDRIAKTFATFTGSMTSVGTIYVMGNWETE